MAFVNEYISEENIKKYDIEALDKKYNKGFNKPDWTVDHERDMYLRYIKSGREEFSDEYKFCFYWQAQLFEMTFKVNGGGVRSGELWRHYDLLYIDLARSFTRTLPESLKPYQAEILSHVKDALTVFQEIGIKSICASHTATFGF